MNHRQNPRCCSHLCVLLQCPSANAGLISVQLFPMSCMLPGVFVKDSCKLWVSSSLNGTSWVDSNEGLLPGCRLYFLFPHILTQSTKDQRALGPLFFLRHELKPGRLILMASWPSESLLPNTITLVVRTWPIIRYQSKIDTLQLNRIEITEQTHTDEVN